MALLGSFRKKNGGKNIYLSIDWNDKDKEDPDRYLERLTEILSKHSISSDLRRYDIRNESIEATYFLDLNSTDNLSALSDELRRTFPSVGITFLDQKESISMVRFDLFLI